VQATVERWTAFEDFYRSERPSVLRAIIFAVNDRDLALECTDEAMARAYERWADVSVGSNPTGWVFRVAVNLANSRHRRRRLERIRPIRSARPPDDIEGVADPAVARALAALPLDQRAVIVLRFHLDWSVDQIAEALGHPAGTVKSRLHRGLRRLETMLKESA
jgi:RNA polymerase sigma factor (sigma-70 family)